MPGFLVKESSATQKTPQVVVIVCVVKASALVPLTVGQFTDEGPCVFVKFLEKIQGRVLVRRFYSFLVPGLLVELRLLLCWQYDFVYFRSLCYVVLLVYQFCFIIEYSSL